MKTCRECGEEKPLSEFIVHPTSRDGYRYDCRECWNKRARIQRVGLWAGPHGHARGQGLAFLADYDRNP